MKICVCSDSHHNISYFTQMLEHEKPDVLFFLGDGERDIDMIDSALLPPYYAVRGNMDTFSSLTVMRLLIKERHRLLITHGHTLRVKNGLDLLAMSAENHQADIVFYGHTHLARADLIDSRLFINPGSIGSTEPSYCALNLTASGAEGGIYRFDAEGPYLKQLITYSKK